MISALGIASLAVLLFCVGALILHFRVMQKKSRVEGHFADLDNLLRDRLELVMDLCADSTPGEVELAALCESYVDGDVRDIIKALPKLRKAIDSFEEIFASDEYIHNTGALEDAAQDYNAALDTYNGFIANYPGKLMAQALGLAPEKPLKLNL